MTLQPDTNGWLKVWEKPLPNSLYFISADVGKSGDFSSASVNHWGRNEQVATVHGHFEPDFFGQILFKLGIYYNTAVVIPENNGIGAGAVAALRLMDYPQLYTEKVLTDNQINKVEEIYGFNTNTRTRPLLIASGQKAIREHACIIRDADYILEMQAFQRNSDGKFEAARTSTGIEKDDRVMTFLIGQWYYQTHPIPEFAGIGSNNSFAAPDNAPTMNSPMGTGLDTMDFTS